MGSRGRARGGRAGTRARADRPGSRHQSPPARRRQPPSDGPPVFLARTGYTVLSARYIKLDDAGRPAYGAVVRLYSDGGDELQMDSISSGSS